MMGIDECEGRIFEWVTVLGLGPSRMDCGLGSGWDWSCRAVQPVVWLVFSGFQRLSVVHPVIWSTIPVVWGPGESPQSEVVMTCLMLRSVCLSRQLRPLGDPVNQLLPEKGCAHHRSETIAGFIIPIEISIRVCSPSSVFICVMSLRCLT